MSRQFCWSYEIDNPTAEQQQLWEHRLDDHADLYPEAVCQGGGCGPEQLSVWLWCNRTKISVYADRLDAVFGTVGRVVDLKEEYA